jgi:crotonobetainyl-CoA:carnitine CoA-transferase CaiB-like acyl-CoA transferase
MSQTPGEIKWTGRNIGQDTLEILTKRLNLTAEEIADLAKSNIINLGEKD